MVNYNAQSAQNQDLSLFSKKVRAILHRRDQIDLVICEYVGQQEPDGTTVIDTMKVSHLSNPATSIRLRKLSEPEFGRLEIPILDKIKGTGPKGSDLYVLADGVTLEDIQAVMRSKGYSYEKYSAEKKKRDGKFLDNKASDSDIFDEPLPEDQDDYWQESDQKEEFAQEEIKPDNTNALLDDGDTAHSQINVSNSYNGELIQELKEPELNAADLAQIIGALKKSFSEEIDRLDRVNLEFKKEIDALKEQIAELKKSHRPRVSKEDLVDALSEIAGRSNSRNQHEPSRNGVSSN